MLAPLVVAACVRSQVALTAADGRCASLASWQACYPRRVVRCYSDRDLALAVRGTRWQRVWPTLRPVERADVWRYLHVWRHGGVYADSDAYCVRPLPARALVVGIDARPPSEAEAARVHIRYPAQYAQWVFAAAAPRHPALKAVLDDIYAAWLRGGPHTTLNFTGPGAFTRALLPLWPPDRALPQEAFACNGYGGAPGLCQSSGVLVRHSFAGSWKHEMR